MIFLPLHKFICQRCMASQLSNHTWMSIINNRQFNTNHNLQNVRKSVSKHVRSDTSGGFGHKAKEATRTTYYTAVVVLGVGVTGLMMYSVFKELLFSFSPQTVYSAAVEKCVAHPRVNDYLGDSVKSYGEESRRGRRQHISHLSYEVEGNKGLRIKFHLKGQRRTATANLDARETSSGWEFRYLFVQLDSYPYEVIVIEDNRGTVFDSSSSAELSSLPGT
ncbi:mitochondrial import inner membrane translocase subunit Tim21-like isoform X2 [Homarus americanus]|nr:mitochondrial import inner membrane translocase subunit Tim21-like isoform X2 [Homarus americanus]XP_042225705.1 mitochondrial import inner membrane translocase subunit Tim21-like isoform X2 [Homarus americanus]XP_042225707.1 mitochondrial import inner membrane translocase subunit Tim21-like isoform X2 [Homarus americanus]XP_042225708.1 mitochondrial import inner membrane translocase subunit Tim21-like isoform X2 [Homarus americanus]